MAELNEEYVRKLEDVLELYERPYNQAEPVVCLDEKPVTLHRDVRSLKPPAPGQVAQRDSEYERCGTANVFCAVEPKAGQHYTRPTPDRCAAEFAQIMAELALNYPTTQTIHLLARLKEEARAWNANVNEARTKIDWQFSRKDARRKLGYNKYLSKRSQH